jgi:hypothetical protein
MASDALKVPFMLSLPVERVSPSSLKSGLFLAAARTRGFIPEGRGHHDRPFFTRRQDIANREISGPVIEKFAPTRIAKNSLFSCNP